MLFLFIPLQIQTDVSMTFSHSGTCILGLFSAVYKLCLSGNTIPVFQMCVTGTLWLFLASQTQPTFPSLLTFFFLPVSRLT